MKGRKAGRCCWTGTPLERFRGYVPVQMIWQHPELSVNPARRLKTVLAEGDWPEDGGVMRGRIEKEMGILEEWKERYPAEVSGGELQRFSIARALGQRTEILLADEITAMLDLITQRQIWSALLKETQSRGISLVAVSPFSGAFGKDLQPDPPSIRNIWIRLTNSGNFIKIRVLTRI